MWALVSPLRALDPERAITQYVQNVWRAPGALPHDDVTTILQTRDGYLWIGTVEGLARFDGCLLYTSPSPRDRTRSRMPSSA